MQISNLKAEKFLVTNSINRLFCVTFEKALYSATSIATNILNSLHSDVISCTSKCYIFIEVPMTVRNATFKDDVTQGCKMSPLQKRLRHVRVVSSFPQSASLLGFNQSNWDDENKLIKGNGTTVRTRKGKREGEEGGRRGEESEEPR